MITAVDTSVLLDIFLPDPRFGPASRKALRAAIADGRIVACEVVIAEVASSFPSSDAARAALEQLGLELSPLGLDATLLAGDVFRRYRERGGRRQRIVADFLVGAHARRHAERLLTRDRGFYRTYFAGLSVLDPSAA